MTPAGATGGWERSKGKGRQTSRTLGTFPSPPSNSIIHYLETQDGLLGTEVEVSRGGLVSRQSLAGLISPTPTPHPDQSDSTIPNPDPDPNPNPNPNPNLTLTLPPLQVVFILTG